MISIFKFVAAPAGRLVQGVLGSALITLSLFWIDTGHGAIVGILGLILLADCVFDVCALALPFGLPFQGLALRKELLRRQLRPNRSSGNRLSH